MTPTEAPNRKLLGHFSFGNYSDLRSCAKAYNQVTVNLPVRLRKVRHWARKCIKVYVSESVNDRTFLALHKAKYTIE